MVSYTFLAEAAIVFYLFGNLVSYGLTIVSIAMWSFYLVLFWYIWRAFNAVTQPFDDAGAVLP